ncbi:hypothetical protein AA0472_2446 [Acetobacter estunensis NRIC 0472]|uniref:Uncharacterized protein n=1 Tax=Komagataeibacter intermedius NRIC 0521 TaxID=1307934 RepID=A0ABQ0PK78_9PROT|nr:hypothetical protein Gain_0181_001 [Komagataeibacter intermedius TF2]GBQ27583.1 hypothetical protein AA0472_2446 [Acetobacter estunensis NRIC 0472]GBQ73505.1 hypothetical protein AA0521_2367 [Komagataeibacter intermedius NRIC 0521]
MVAQCGRQITVVFDNCVATDTGPSFKHEHRKPGIQSLFCYQTADYASTYNDDIAIEIGWHKKFSGEIQNDGMLRSGTAVAFQALGADFA